MLSNWIVSKTNNSYSEEADEGQKFEMSDCLWPPSYRSRDPVQTSGDSIASNIAKAV